jgi:hypothetical protein
MLYGWKPLNGIFGRHRQVSQPFKSLEIKGYEAFRVDREQYSSVRSFRADKDDSERVRSLSYRGR